jgi:hypothetical protein
LIAPVRAEDFFREHWGPPSGQNADSILTNGILKSIISFVDLRYLAIHLAKDGSYVRRRLMQGSSTAPSFSTACRISDKFNPNIAPDQQ